MSFNDLGAKNAPSHVDTPEQAEARAQAVAGVKAKAEAKAAKAAARRESQKDAAKPVPAAKHAKGEPAK
jgi:hypothetical protein